MRRLSQTKPAFRYAGAPDVRAARSFAHSLEAALLLVALLCFGYLGYVSLDRFAFETLQSARLDDVLGRLGVRAKPEAVATGARASAAAGGLIGRLEIPGVGIDAIVAEGVDTVTLRRAVGHLPDTSFPGEKGNVALAGHRDTIFRGLRHIELDERIVFATPDGRFEYFVDQVSIVEPEHTAVLDPGPDPSLTLITCYPFNYVGPAPLRYVVRARQVRDADRPEPAKDQRR